MMRAMEKADRITRARKGGLARAAKLKQDRKVAAARHLNAQRAALIRWLKKEEGDEREG